MFLQVEISAESLVAGRTSERLLVCVRMHMESQIIRLIEALLTYGTLKSLLIVMSQPMISVVSILMERLSTDVTDVRFSSQVNSNVCVQSGRSVEAFSACHACMRSEFRVNDLVSAKCGRLPK